MSNKISIETAYNVEIDFQLANIWDRVWAYIIDLLIKIGYVIFIFLSLANVLENFQWAYAILLIPYFFYSLAFEVFSNGQTPGKKAMQIKVVSLDGKNLRTGQLIMRWIIRIIDFFIFSASVAFLAVVSTKRAQRLGDLAADTTVITLKDKTSIKKASRVKLPENYQGQNRQVLQLQDSDIELLKQVIRDKTDAADKVRTSMSLKMIDLLEIPKTGNSKDYLKMIVYDYNYFQMLDDGLIDAPRTAIGFQEEE